MTKREKIEAKKQKNLEKIEALKMKNIELTKDSLLLSDEKQWFEEKIESHPKLKYQREVHWLDGKLVGRIHWVDQFEDEFDGTLISINRSQVVRVDGEWI